MTDDPAAVLSARDVQIVRDMIDRQIEQRPISDETAAAAVRAVLAAYGVTP